MASHALMCRLLPNVSVSKVSSVFALGMNNVPLFRGSASHGVFSMSSAGVSFPVPCFLGDAAATYGSAASARPLHALLSGASTFSSSAASSASPGDEAAAAVYEVAIRTGDRRGAGTPCGAEIELFGMDARDSSGPHVVGTEKGFVTGGCDAFDVHSPTDLGDSPARLRLRRLEAGSSDLGAGWYVYDVLVVRRGGRRGMRYHIDGWLGESDSGGVKGEDERLVTGVTVEDVKSAMDATRLTRNSLSDSEINALAKYPVLLYAGAAVLPHPEKLETGGAGAKAAISRTFGNGGEDSFFIARGGMNGGATALGVADGVFAWRDQGIDAGEYSRGLMRAALQAAESADTHPRPDALQLMSCAAKGVSDLKLQGSSTCCIVSVCNRNGILKSANLGDSGFIVLRPSLDGTVFEVKNRSVHMEHEFGRPYQLGHHDHGDKPEDAHFEQAALRPGDVLVLGSDGLYDNLSDEDIADLITKTAGTTANKTNSTAAWSHALASSCARVLASHAFEASVNKTADTPYSRAATEFFDMVYSGGKRDDITVVVALAANPPKMNE